MSAGWLSSVLGSEVEEFSIEPIGHGTGFAGSVFRVHLTFRIGGAGSGSDQIGPWTVIWKTSSVHPSTHRLLTRLGAYGAEAVFYSKLAGSVPLAPEVYFSGYESGSGTPCILLEDLGGMDAGDQIQGCSLEQSYEVVKALAGLHAAFWSREIEGIPTFDAAAVLFDRMHRISWRNLRRSDGDIPVGLLKAAIRIAPHVVTIKRRLATPPVTLIHGDVRSDNLFFGGATGPGSLKLIDWQAIRTGRGCYDLAYFLATSVPIEVRRRHQDELVEEYVGALESHGVTDYDVATYIEDLRWSLLDVVTFAGIIFAALDFGSGRGLQLSNVIMSRLWATLADNDALELLK